MVGGSSYHPIYLLRGEFIMHNLIIDLETYSSTDISKSGVYRYAEDKEFEILLFGYSVDFNEAKVIDLKSGEKIPEEVIEAIKSDDVLKWAHNASFERVCLSRYLRLPTQTYLDPSSWRCSMVYASLLGLPKALKDIGVVLELDKQKLDEGKDLIRYFSLPCKATKSNKMRTRNLPIHDISKWTLFKEYNKRDVDSEVEIIKRLSAIKVPDFIWREYSESERINDRGVLIDKYLVSNAIDIAAKTNENLLNSLQNLTNLSNPNSVTQLKKWLIEQGLEVEDLGKKNVEWLIKSTTNHLISSALALRLQTSKSSIKKYEAMEKCKLSDQRIRGMFQFYGASRTGRFASKFVQLQNLRQNHLSDLEGAREIVKNGDIEALNILYDDIPDVLSQLIRTAFIPKKNHKFIVADFSAIEARVLAWYAGETWVLDAFKNGEDIYCATASKMYGIPVVKHGINGDLRQKGKQANLACGYGGSIGALKAMGALDAGLKEEELQELVDSWRSANPHIVRFWWDIDKAIRTVIKEHREVSLYRLSIYFDKGVLFIKLPSGRTLAYIRPRISDINGDITYEGIGNTKKWERIDSYGPKFVENIVQATARDILCNSIHNLKAYDIVMHIHDEVVIEASLDTKLEEVTSLMSKSPSWASDLLLRADGYECNFYQKD